MGHACEILHFDVKATKAEIIAECDDWGNANADHRERGYYGGGLGFPIRFTSEIFDTREAAEKRLSATFGNYDQIAVRYKVPVGKGAQPTQKLLSLRKRVQELRMKYETLANRPHYAGVSSKTVGCKNCGSALATAYCGKSYKNHCPVCRADLRPPSTIEALQRMKGNLDASQKELRDLEQAFAKKQVSQKYELCWAVACEVHC